MTSPDPELQALREKWAPEWCVWRARRNDDRQGSLMATRRGEGRELSMTLMERTADELEAALREQGARVGQALMRIDGPRVDARASGSRGQQPDSHQQGGGSSTTARFNESR